ncbi:hypothetical protein D1003_04840 [Riemerella anatipestifer]|nr:hypothetical protein [Riemerella anatipestifer]
MNFDWLTHFFKRKINFQKLKSTRHMLEWLSEEPFDAILSSVEEMFCEQRADTKLLSFKVTSEPQWLTGGKKVEESQEMIVVRCGVAFSCEFILKNGNEEHLLKGVFSWVGIHMDTQPTTKMWMDLDGTLEEFGKEGRLMERIYLTALD